MARTKQTGKKEVAFGKKGGAPWGAKPPPKTFSYDEMRQGEIVTEFCPSFIKVYMYINI